MATISNHEHAAVQRRLATLREEMYQLALQEMREGVRVQKLRSLMAEMRALQAVGQPRDTTAEQTRQTIAKSKALLRYVDERLHPKTAVHAQSNPGS